MMLAFNVPALLTKEVLFTKFNPVGKMSVTSILVAKSGPALFTVIEYVTTLPTL